MASDVRSVIAIASCLFAMPAGATETEAPRYEIASIRAHAYYHGTGAIDERNLAAGRVALWNAIGGAGDLRAPTEVTLVIVDVKGEFSPASKDQVELRATVEGRELAHIAAPLPTIWSQTKSAKVPFLVYDTGCGTLELTARLLRKGKAYATQTASVGFTCGE